MGMRVVKFGESGAGTISLGQTIPTDKYIVQLKGGIAWKKQ